MLLSDVGMQHTDVGTQTYFRALKPLVSYACVLRFFVCVYKLWALSRATQLLHYRMHV